MRLRATAGWAVTVLLAAAGCGQTSGTNDTGSGTGGSDTDPEPGVGTMSLDYVRSGTRVVALGYSSNEARVFRTFHDQELGFDCSFVPDAAGQSQRCVPNQQVPLIYTDADCKEPAGWVERWGDEEVAAPGDESVLREALLVYAREIAFATAQVYAQAAEARGAWDARLESLVVNAVLSDHYDARMIDYLQQYPERRLPPEV